MRGGRFRRVGVKGVVDLHAGGRGADPADPAAHPGKAAMQMSGQHEADVGVPLENLEQRRALRDLTFDSGGHIVAVVTDPDGDTEELMSRRSLASRTGSDGWGATRNVTAVWTWWFEEHVDFPVDDLLSRLSVGDEVPDLERCQKLATGIEALFRSEARAQYAGWPPESTTDGSRVDLCIRARSDSLDVAGLVWIGFGGAVFPFRAEIKRSADRSISVTGYIGQVDPKTGEPPRLPEGTFVVSVRDERGRNPVAELIVGRRQIRITWTKVFEVASPGRDSTPARQ